MNLTNYRTRLSIDISREHADKLYKYLEWGIKGKVFRVIVSDLIEMIEKFGVTQVVGAFLERHITLQDIVKIKLEEKDGKANPNNRTSG